MATAMMHAPIVASSPTPIDLTASGGGPAAVPSRPTAPIGLVATSAPEVEMTDASSQLASGAAPGTIEWSVTDQLLLVSAVQRAHAQKAATLTASETPVPLSGQLDWPSIASTLHAKSTSQAAVGAFPPDACLARFSQLAIESGVRPDLAASKPLPPLTLADLAPIVLALIPKLAQERIKQLESEHALAAAKQAKLEALTAEAQQRLQAQQNAAAAAALPAATPTVKLEVPPTPSRGTTGLMMSPTSRSESGAAPRPSPLLVNSPSINTLTNMQQQQTWPNSSLHTPLKSMSQMPLSRQSSAASGMQSPMLSRQQSVDAPYTPTAGNAPNATLSPAKLAEVFETIIATLCARPEAEPFLVPVDPNDAVGYYEVIKNPMSFEDVKKKVASGEITQPIHLWHALNQIYQNCYTYNDKKTSFYRMGKTLEGITIDMFRKHMPGGYQGPWEQAGNKKGAPRPPKYTPVTPSPSLVTSHSYTASPLPSPTAASSAAAAGTATPAGAATPFAPIPLNLSLANAGTGATAAVPSTPSTPTRKNTPASGRGSGADVDPESSDLPKGAPRRTSVHSSTTKKRDTDGDETMPSVSEEGGAGGAAEDNDEGEIGSIHDALTTPARAAQRKRAASAMLATSTPVSTSGTAAAAPPSAAASAASTAVTPARKNARGTKAPATPNAAAAATPSSAPPSLPLTHANSTVSDDAMDTADSNATDKGKPRGRPRKK